MKTVVMELTGVYWIPVFEILEQRGFEVMVVNARDEKRLPGRKTDVSDAQWLQRLHEYRFLRQLPAPGSTCRIARLPPAAGAASPYAAVHISTSEGADTNELSYITSSRTSPA